MKRNDCFRMDYRQVKERVVKEKAALGGIVLETGIGMFLFFLAMIFLFR